MKRFLTVLLVAVAVIAAGCAGLPPPEDRIASTAFADTGDTRLGRATGPLVAAHPGTSGFHAFPRPYDAFGARVLLAAAAEKSIDAQYYIWSGDQVGYLLFEALWRAAERGVRVRLLLDDANTAGLDPTIAALDAHPKIEVRLYNPFAQRGSRALGYLTDFARLNRRMHNKSFTVDNQVTLVGGRNVANEYFGAGSGLGFADLDVMGVGPVVRDVSREFDLYWNSASAYPADRFVGAPGPNGAAELRDRFAATRADPESVAYIDAVRGTLLVDEMLERRVAFEWTTAQVVHDDPAKTLDTADRIDVLLFPELMKRIGTPEKSFDIMSPYFVPGDGGAELLAGFARRGVKVRVLTNSLAASDESIVHAGYAKRRRDLLRAGVELWELKPTATRESTEGGGAFGSGKHAGLHAKTYAVDRSRIFVGSFNFDMRSARLNTEMGVVIDSPAFAEQLAASFEKVVPQVAYQVRLAPDGDTLQWVERTASGEQRLYDVDPETSWFLRWRVGVMSLLAIDWML
jgi:cardiolipin synthase C